MGEEQCDYCKGSALVTVVRFCPSCEKGRSRQAALPSTKAADAALSLLAEARAVLGDAYQRGHLGSPHRLADGTEVDVAGLLAELNAATREEAM